MTDAMNYLGQPLVGPGQQQLQPATQQNPNDMLRMIFDRLFTQQQPQQQSNGLGELVAAMRPRHLGMDGREISPTAPSPFDSGFFKSADQRAAVEQKRLGVPGFSSLSPGQQAGALSINPNSYENRVAGAQAAGQPTFQVSDGTQALLAGVRGAGKPRLPNLPGAYANMTQFPNLVR